MTPSETRDAARVMLDSLKKGAIVQWRGQNHNLEEYPNWEECVPIWNWDDCNYRVRFIKPKEKKKGARK